MMDCQIWASRPRANKALLVGAPGEDTSVQSGELMVGLIDRFL